MAKRAELNRKVLLIQLCDVVYGTDLSRRLDDKDLIYYTECKGPGSPLNFYVVGPANDLKRTASYAYNNYNSRFRKVVATRLLDWKVGIASMNEECCDHVLTSCTAVKFVEKVREMYKSDPTEVPPCKYRHAKVLPVWEDTTFAGRYVPIVPYTVEAEDNSDNEQSDIVCFCKCENM